MNTDHHDPLPEPPEFDVLAGEYVLGVLDAQARRDLEARLPRDPAFAREVAVWEQRFAPWLEQIDGVAPPEALWLRIRGQLGLTPVTRAAERGLPLWQRLGFWHGLTAAALATTAASLAALFLARQPQLPTPVAPPAPVAVQPAVVPQPLVAKILHTDGSPAYTAMIDLARGTMLVIPVSGAGVPADRVPELWLIAGDGVPRSLGLTNTEQAHTVTIPEPLRASLQPQAVLAVSIEPPGGSPTGLPTGAVIAQGGMTAL